MAGNACIVADDSVVAEGVDIQGIVALAGSMDKHLTNLHFKAGLLGGHATSVMRDTGCTGAEVQRSLTTPEQMTGDMQTNSMLDGTVRSAPVAQVCLSSPYYTGSLEALCVDKPLCDVIIGNIKGASDGYTNRQDDCNAVVTRAQEKASQSSFKTMKVASGLKFDMSHDELIHEQKNDSTLSRAFEQATKGETITFDRGSVAEFKMISDILHRVYTNTSGKQIKQMVVPKCKCDYVGSHI